jgi:hypothetical protein
MKFLSFSEAKDKRLRTVRESKRRLLKVIVSWARISVARKQYDCNYYIEAIEPGYEYERIVYVNYFHLWFKRLHYPRCSAASDDEIDKRME